jgi:hypothetical protein
METETLSHFGRIAGTIPLPVRTTSLLSIRPRVALRAHQLRREPICLRAGSARRQNGCVETEKPAASPVMPKEPDRNRPEPIAEGYGLGAGVNQEPGAEMQIGKLSYVIWEVALGNMGKS